MSENTPRHILKLEVHKDWGNDYQEPGVLTLHVMDDGSMRFGGLSLLMDKKDES